MAQTVQSPSVVTPVDLLTEAAATFPNRIAFQIPKPVSSGARLEEWKTITFQAFATDVRSCANYWSHVLRRKSIKQRDIVVLWYVLYPTCNVELT